MYNLTRSSPPSHPAMHPIDGTISCYTLDGIIYGSSCLMNSLRFLFLPLVLLREIFIYFFLKGDITKLLRRLFPFSISLLFALSRPWVESKSNKFRYGRHKSLHWEDPKKSNIFLSLSLFHLLSIGSPPFSSSSSFPELLCLHRLALIHEETTPFQVPSLILATLKALIVFLSFLFFFFHLLFSFCVLFYSFIYSPTSTTSPAMATMTPQWVQHTN